MDAILLGIDGTGPYGTNDYQSEMRNSFVRYILTHSPAKVKRYERGPGMDGLDMSIIAAKGYQYIHLNRFARPNAPVYLAGYSRGAAGVIAVAQRLAEAKVNVRAMMLFDAVDRAIGIDSYDIPNNVEHVVHARRDPNAFTRNSFGNCGTRWHAPTKYELSYFRGTHGAVGGCPWPIPKGGKRGDFIKEAGEATPTLITYAQDTHAAHAVWTWTKPRLIRLGFFGTQAEAQAVVA